MAEENSSTPVSDLDNVDSSSFLPKGLPPLEMDPELSSYLVEQGVIEAPTEPSVKPGSGQSMRDSLFDFQTADLGIATDPFKMGKEVHADFRNPHNQNQFYERYASHSEFENLGFNPFRDNEALYNENSNMFEELGRSFGQWTGLVGLGFKDAAGFGDLTDRDNAAEMERAMAVGSSSKGGFTGFTNNLFLNSGYTVGIMGELALEEVGMLGVEAALGIGTVATGGAAAPALAANTGLMASRAARAFGKIKTALGASYSLSKQLGNLKDINKARSMWSKGLGKAGKIINPFENTVDLYRNKSKLDHLNKWQKTYKGFAEMYKDVRNFRLAWGEGALEGGMIQNQMERELLADFRAENGRGPNEEEGQEIIDTARRAGVTTSVINMPVIMLSNKLVFDGLLGRGRFKNLYADVIETGHAGKIIFKPGVKGAKAYNKMATGLQGRWDYIKSPRMWAAGAAKYGKANIAEGLQEVFQETITGASEDYYGAMYRGDANRGGYMSSIVGNLVKQVGPQGLETFMSGFLMGGMVGPVSTGVGNITQAIGGNSAGFADSRAGKIGTAIGNQFTKMSKGQEAYQKKVDEQTDQATKRNTKLEKDIETLNEFYEDPTKYFSPELENLVSQKAYKEAMDEAEKRGDKRMFHDMADSAETKHVMTALKYGRLDGHITRMEEMKQFSAEEFKTLNTELSQEDFNFKIDASIDRAKKIQSTWDYASKKFPNPFTPYKYRPGTDKFKEEAMKQVVWNNAIEEMVFQQESFNRALERQQSIYQNIHETAGLKKMSTSDINVLFDEQSVLSEIGLLKMELEGNENTVGLKQSEALTPDMKQMIAKKDAKLKALEAYDKALKEFKSSKTEEVDEPTVNALHKAYKEYMSVMAEQSGEHLNVDKLDASFEALADSHLLTARAGDLNRAVNILSDPKNFLSMVDRKNARIKVLYDNREVEIRKSLEEFRKLAEKNEMLNRLYDEGMFFDPKDLALLESEGKMPVNFYYADTTDGHKQGEVLRTSADYAKAIGIVTKAMKAQGIDVEDIIIMEQDANAYTSQSRRKSAGDARTYVDLAQEFGFDPEKDSSEVPLVDVLEAIIANEHGYNTEHEIALAQQLLKKADSKETVTFSRKEKTPGAYTSAGAVVDPRYSSDEYHQGRTGHPIEHVILHTEIKRRVFEATKGDADFKKNMTRLWTEARTAYAELSPEAQAAMDGVTLDLFQNLDSFMAAAMSNPTFQEFLATVHTKVETTKSVWQKFVDAIMAHLKGATLGHNGTVLNAALDLITAKIEGIGVAPTKTATEAETTTAPTKTTAETKGIVANTMPPSQMKKDHPDLWQTLVDLYKEQNIDLISQPGSIGDEALLPGFESMSDEEIGKSPQFAAYIKGPWPKASAAIYSYNKSLVKPTVEVPLGSTEDVSNEEIDEFKKSKFVSRARIVKMAEKQEKGTPHTLREKMLLKNDIVRAGVEHYLDTKAKKPPTIVTGEMKEQLRELGFSENQIKTLHARPEEAWRLINEGITNDELNATAQSAAATPSTLNKSGELFHAEMGAILEGIYDYQTLEQAEQELVHITETRSDEMTNAGLTEEDFEGWIGKALQRIAFNFTFEDIQVGEVLIMGGAYKVQYRVEQKSGSELYVEPVAGGKGTWIKKNEIHDKIEYRYNIAMNDPRVKFDESEPVTEEEKVFAEETMEATVEINSAEAIKEDLEQAGTMTAAERMAKLKNNKKC